MFLNNLFRWSRLCTATIALVAMNVGAETITVGGVGSLTPIVQQLGTEYAKKNPGIEVSVVSPPMGSSAGIRALTAGKVDVVVSARVPKSGESGQSQPWLKTPLVLATSDGNSKGLTRAEIADIYSGRKTSWSNNKPIRLVMRGEQETETQVLRSLSPEVDAAVAGALKRSDLPIAENDLDAIDLLARIQGSLGTTNLGLIKASGKSLKMLPIDGVEPTAKTAEDGRYHLLRHFYLITTPNPTPAVAAFVTWLHSTAAMNFARRFDYLPLK